MSKKVFVGEVERTSVGGSFRCCGLCSYGCGWVRHKKYV